MSDEFPRWVTVHESHVVRKGEKPYVSVAVPDFGERFVAPNGTVSVLVNTPEEATRAAQPKDGPADDPPVQSRKSKTKEED